MIAELAGPAVTVASIIALGVWGDRSLARAFREVTDTAAAIIRRLDVIEARLAALEVEAKKGGDAQAAPSPVKLERRN
jgi:hypothetical protein